MSTAFSVMAIVSCNILKPPSMAQGKRGDPESFLTNISCTPIDPVANDFKLEPPLDVPTKLFTTTLETSSVLKNGYILQQGSDSYVIHNVNRITFGGVVSQALILGRAPENG